MKKMFKLIVEVVITILICIFIYDNKENLSDKLIYFYTRYLQPDVKQDLINNDYSKKENYKYVKLYYSNKLNNYNDIKNAVYTFLDSGSNKYILQCNPKYLECTNDMKNLLENKSSLSYINSFVHPFNSYKELNVKISTTGRIYLEKTNLYNPDEIERTKTIVDEIFDKLYDSKKSDAENIKTFHNYIIENATYIKSAKTAYDILINKGGNCSGYSSAMSLFLNKMKIRNYIITSEKHAWNLVYVNGEWRHLDLTWDDAGDNLSHNFFLIDSDELKLKDSENNHDFDKNIYLEAN